MPQPFHLVSVEPSEHELQATLSQALPLVLWPTVAWTCIDHGHSVDRRLGRNGVPLGIMETQARKKRGVKKGIPDYLFWHQGRGFALELKVGDNDLDDDQEAFIKSLIAAAVECKVCWTEQQFFQTLHDWGLLRCAVTA